jgi:hypothetical protein
MIINAVIVFKQVLNKVKPENNNQPRDLNIGAVVDKWSCCLEVRGPSIAVTVDRWSVFWGGC